MFRTAAANPPTDAGNNVLPAELVPLSVLELDLAAPDAGWAAYLADRSISITIDDIGRAAVSRSDARQLFTEKREREARVREHAAELERRAVEADQRWRAQLPGGVPASVFAGFETYGQAIASAELDAQAYRPRASVAEDLLSNDGAITYHPIQHGEDEEW